GGSFKHNLQKGDVPLAPKYHRWQSVDFSNPAYRRGQHRLDLNHPPTSVGGIWLGWASLCRPDFNNPPTAIGGIQLSFLMAHRVSRQTTLIFILLKVRTCGFFAWSMVDAILKRC